MRRLPALLVALLLGLALPASAAAADHVSLTVTDPAGAPLADVAVALTVSADQEVGATALTDAAGLASFSLSLPAGARTWTAVAMGQRNGQLDGCTSTTSIDGSASASGPQPPADWTLVAKISVAFDCGTPPADGPLLALTYATVDGRTPPLQLASAEERRADGATYTAGLAPTGPGQLAARLFGWPAAHIQVSLIGQAVAGSPDAAGCVTSTAATGHASFTLAGAAELGPLILDGEPLVSAVCGNTGTPPPGTPRLTPPPTDGQPLATTTPAPSGPLALLGLLALGGTLFAFRPRRRRG